MNYATSTEAVRAAQRMCAARQQPIHVLTDGADRFIAISDPVARLAIEAHLMSGREFVRDHVMTIRPATSEAA